MTASTDTAKASGEPAHPLLRRELGTWGAVLLGLGSILGTGVFVSTGIAAGVAGPAVLVAVALAAGVALCNALSSAQLAAAHPVSGGTYEYGYTYLRPVAGFAAGWMFLCAKTASAATAALGFAGYLLGLLGVADLWARRGIAAAVAVVLTAVVLTGMKRTRLVNGVIIAVTLTGLAAFVAGLAPAAVRDGGQNLRPFWPEGGAGGMAPLLHATALMFVAYTGYGRLATLGEEVHEPRRTIPRAIGVTLAVSAVLYMAVALVGIAAAGGAAFGSAAVQRAAPLEIIARRLGPPGLWALVAAAAMTAMLGVLLNLVLGLSRVWLAMGRRGDMPAGLGRLNEARTTPTAAVLLVGVTIVALAMIGDVKTTWAFSAFTVLVYYALTNLSCLALPRDSRLYPRAFAWAGLGACAFLAFWVPWRIWAVGLGILALGLVWHFARRRLHRRPA